MCIIYVGWVTVFRFIKKQKNLACFSFPLLFFLKITQRGKARPSLPPFKVDVKLRGLGSFCVSYRNNFFAPTACFFFVLKYDKKKS